MRLPKSIRRSFGLTQAVAVLFASLIFSLIISTVHLSYTFKKERRASIELSEEVLTLAEGGATTASWTLDAKLANELIQSVIALGDVQMASLTDESGNILAVAERQNKTYGAVIRYFAKTFIGDSIRGQRLLSVPTNGGVKQVGILTIVLSPEHLAERFAAVATPVLITSVIQALAIGLILLWLASRLVTNPLQRAAAVIAKIDPANPNPEKLVIPPMHRENEFGHLLRHTNKMVRRLSTVQAQLRALATHDPLTGLPNRDFVVSHLVGALRRADRNESQVAVLFLDLDGFKTVNDSHGHNHGDELLAQVAQRLKDVLRSNDSVGRLGGDEFLIVVEDVTSSEEIIPTAQRIEGIFAHPFVVEVTEVRVSCSIGAALYPEDGINAVDLMRHADMAMYQAKADPRSHFHFFAQEMSDRMQARLKMEAALRQALKDSEFKLAYQAKIAADTGRLAGCEILLRWEHEGRLIPAVEFIDAAEQTGLIVDIGYQVLEGACAQIREWLACNINIPVAINVSARQLREPDFAKRLIETAARFEIPADMLELEITETVFIEELDHAITKLNKLRKAGFTISIDDFGTGYSSLSYLTQLPANSLKIDKSFVSGAQSSEVVLDMIVAMAQSLQLTTVAEGVETEEQRDSLIAKGCDVLQGYLFCKPMLAAEFEKTIMNSPWGIRWPAYRVQPSTTATATVTASDTATATATATAKKVAQ